MATVTKTQTHESYTAGAEVDSTKYPTAQKLLRRCQDFFAEVQNLTPGKDLEAYLNTNYGPGNAIYEDLCNLTRQGLQEGWVANIEISDKNYRRSKVALPKDETRFFSITTVYMNSQHEFSGQYHSHPYGEINCVVQIDKTAELKGMQGWQGAGWTSPGAGTHQWVNPCICDIHVLNADILSYPQVRGGALVALFFLPAGRISYTAKEGDAQPVSL